MEDNKEYTWLKSKGYLHITAQIDVQSRQREIVSKVTDPSYVSKYAFFPLIHTNINERKYKKLTNDESIRAHCYIDDTGKPVKTVKSRPLHYATHLDAIIFGYYAQLLQEKYEKEIAKYEGLCDCIIAYRKIPSDIEGKHKSTIHFAKEIFDEIKQRTAQNEDCVVLTFDIKSFFSTLDHKLLKSTWAKLLRSERLPEHHYNVFKAATQFSYIYLDELRRTAKQKGRKAGFDEKELARIRNKHGIHAFFESPRAFREKVKEGSVKLYKYPFRNKKKEPIGIPQGLPISAVLANLYLLDFDKKVLNYVVGQLGGYYRRYSDDIVVVCNNDCASAIEAFIGGTLEESKVQISVNKTEKFLFKKVVFGKKEPRLTSIKILEGNDNIGAPFNYLGFEFNGQKALIKSANLAKFYRRMISSVRRKAKRGRKVVEERPGEKPCIFRRQLYRLYTTRPLNNVKVRNRWKKLQKIENGEYRLISGVKKKDLRSNYLTYVYRASEIMGEPAIEKQVRKHKAIFNHAIHKHLNQKNN